MGILDYFKKVSSMTADEARDFIRDRDPDEYVLLDVRQPKEYERGHIPGARLIPVGELHDRLASIDRGKPVIAY